MMQGPPAGAGERRRQHAWLFVASAGALLSFVVTGWLVRGAPPPPPGFVPTAEVRAAPGAPLLAVDRRAAEPPEAAVTGRASDAGGEPLVGWRVELQVQRQQEPFGSPFRLFGPAVSTDPDGCFWFDAVEPGRYRVRLEGTEVTSGWVELAEGERRRVDLQLRADRRAVVLMLTRHGAPLRGRRIQLLFADGEARACSETGGAYRFPAPAGNHRLRVSGTGAGARTAPLRDSGYFVAELPLVVPSGGGEWRATIEVPTPELEVVASDGSSAPLPQLQFVVEGTAAFGGDTAKWEFGAADGRSGRLDELPPGAWKVTAQSPCFDAEPQLLQVAGGAAVHRVVITGRRAAVVRLDLRELDGQPFRLPLAAKMFADSLPPLRCGDRTVACTDVASALVPRVDGVVLGFAGVPPGPATWPLADREVDGELHFLLFDPQASPTLLVDPAGGNTLTLCMQPRAFVEWIACGSTGMELPRAVIDVFRGATKVAPLGVLRRSRWQGCLPPGEYRVVIREQGAATEPGAEREHRLFVQRQNQWLRLRP